MPSDQAPRVFISYSHDLEEHAERVLHLADQLRAEGVDAWIDQYEPAPPQGWPHWMEEQIERADFVLCVCTEIYLRRFNRQEDEGIGQGVAWEAQLVRNALYRTPGKNRKFWPVIFRPEEEAFIPGPLQGFTFFEPVSKEGYEELYRHLTSQPQVEARKLGKLRPMPSKPRRSLFGKEVDKPEKDDLLAAYGQWARKRYSHLDLIGIDAGDVQVKLEEVYVPLHMAHHREPEAGEFDLFRGSRCLSDEDGDHEPVEIDTLLSDPEARHALLFGEPGSGKTTALKKLHQLSWAKDDGTIPVFLRLRHFNKELLDTGLAAFLEHEIRELSGGRLDGVGEELWKHRRLLLLFDGLDEIADAAYREEVLQRIGWYLGQDDAQSMRTVVSCRRVGLPSQVAHREGLFQTYEVRPFQDEQIAQLVNQWFRELARRGKIKQATADKRVSTLLDALQGRRKASQQILEMASNPLLLTLLCVVVLLGNEIPKKRVRFYEQCLDVLLDRWPRQRNRKAPVELSTARIALSHLAFYLHKEHRRDDLTWAEAVAELMDPLGEANDAQEVFDWAHGVVGLLVDYTKEHYGFVHLGLQEHLTAHHLITNPGDLSIFTGDFDESWWTEVFLQVAALSERQGLNSLMAQLLQKTDALERRSDLLRDCLREASAPELAAFVQVLEQGEDSRRLAVLRLLNGFRFRPTELVDALERLRAEGNREVAEAATQLLEGSLSSGRAEDSFALLIDSPEDRNLAEHLANRLGGWQGGWSAEVIEGTGRAMGKKLARHGTVLVLVGSSSGGWIDAGSLKKIYHSKSWLAVTLPGDSQPLIPEVFADCESFAWRLDQDDALIQEILGHLTRESRKTASEARVEILGQRQVTLENEPKQQPYIEPVTGMVFLPVPGGRFVMGSDNLFSKKERENFSDAFVEAPAPACRVRLSLYWLAKTPVTNKEYGKFLQATGYKEPSTWRDRRFSDPLQPVVNVSWEDAVQFCRWLSKDHPEGYAFQLPSEAQWEFAARGSESWKYPWGDEAPDSTRACYQESKPSVVGAYPKGLGPYGHLDLAGLVWEWCRDAWEPNHSRWAQEEPLDPVGEGDSEIRPLRGGGWYNDAGSLRCAVRVRDWPRHRYGSIGFRLLCAPPSSNF